MRLQLLRSPLKVGRSPSAFLEEGIAETALDNLAQAPTADEFRDADIAHLAGYLFQAFRPKDPLKKDKAFSQLCVLPRMTDPSQAVLMLKRHKKLFDRVATSLSMEEASLPRLYVECTRALGSVVESLWMSRNESATLQELYDYACLKLAAVEALDGCDVALIRHTSKETRVETTTTTVSEIKNKGKNPLIERPAQELRPAKAAKPERQTFQERKASAHCARYGITLEQEQFRVKNNLCFKCGGDHRHV